MKRSTNSTIFSIIAPNPMLKNNALLSGKAKYTIRQATAPSMKIIFSALLVCAMRSGLMNLRSGLCHLLCFLLSAIASAIALSISSCVTFCCFYFCVIVVRSSMMPSINLRVFALNFAGRVRILPLLVNTASSVIHSSAVSLLPSAALYM